MLYSVKNIEMIRFNLYDEDSEHDEKFQECVNIINQEFFNVTLIDEGFYQAILKNNLSDEDKEKAKINLNYVMDEINNCDEDFVFDFYIWCKDDIYYTDDWNDYYAFKTIRKHMPIAKIPEEYLKG